MAEWRCNSCFTTSPKAPRRKTCGCGNGVFERTNPLPLDLGDIDEARARVVYMLKRAGCSIDEAGTILDIITKRHSLGTKDRALQIVYDVWARMRIEDLKNHG